MAVFTLEGGNYEVESHRSRVLPSEGRGGTAKPQTIAGTGGLSPAQGGQELPLCPALLRDGGTGHFSASRYRIATVPLQSPPSQTELYEKTST